MYWNLFTHNAINVIKKNNIVQINIISILIYIVLITYTPVFQKQYINVGTYHDTKFYTSK